MSSKVQKEDIKHIKKRRDYLEEVNRFTLDALERAASLGNFQKSINQLHEPSKIIEESRQKIKQLMQFEATAYFLIDETDADFYLFDCDPLASGQFIQNEVDVLIDDGTFARALKGKKSIVTYTTDHSKHLLLHVMTTESRVRGMFIGLMGGQSPKGLPEASHSLLTIVLMHTANTLESFELYNNIKNVNEALEAEVLKLSESEKELTAHRSHLNDLVEQRTNELANVNEQLIQELKERKQAQEKLAIACHELRATQAQLIQAGKLASIGELAAGVAHELNQPLMVIRTNVQIILRDIKQGEFQADQLESLLEPFDRNTRRMMDIIGNLQTFSRQTQAKPLPIDLNKVIEESMLLIGTHLQLGDIKVQMDLDPNLPKVIGDATQFSQVVLNLLTNARDAIDAKADNTEKRIDIISQTSKDHQAFIEILVKDTGSGIHPDTMQKIFDPFFTTKEVGKGTGLGLSISYGIIKDHNGDIEVIESGPGGTTIRIKLRAATPSAF